MKGLVLDDAEKGKGSVRGSKATLASSKNVIGALRHPSEARLEINVVCMGEIAKQLSSPQERHVKIVDCEEGMAQKHMRGRFVKGCSICLVGSQLRRKAECETVVADKAKERRMQRD